MGETATFKANERIPTRPLSFEHAELRMPKELMIDYTTAAVYISDENSNIVDFTSAVADVIAQDPVISDKITVDNPDDPGGDPISINDEIAILDGKAVTNAENISANSLAIGALEQRVTKVENDYAQKIGLATVATTGSYTDLINAPYIKDTEIELPLSWVGSNPTTQTITVSGLTADMCPPILDLIHTGNYDTETQQDTAWGYIYKAITGANSITFYATETPTIPLRVRIRVISGMSYS